MKRSIPLAIVIGLGFLFMLQAFIPHKISQDFLNEYILFTRSMAVPAIVLGIMSLTMVHVFKIRRRVQNWQFSWVTLLGMFGTATIGFVWGTQAGTPFMWIFQNLQMPMSATMFSLLAFYIASAAYKAFRARSPEATVLLVTAIIVMLGQVPVGAAISHWIPDSTQWFLNVPNLAAKRGIGLGVGLAGVATSLKIILGIERSYLGND